ncbi:hypothetical protein F4827_003882 [Paraburkholderia bannensis]|uniref:Histidine kinase n=1 Tax=Paraburkholderia bannensis TaxID=765414 RepID=A0A7W9WUP3_9BURK|nr:MULTISPECIES: hypothetical protein [Paraburkholderia]MBB3259008.1 hypothetical protein [Paraburkholderia sp. WP4_3_2]MBB6104023.1 hypothetical protein [Paraburkholderia bannensis]
MSIDPADLEIATLQAEKSLLVHELRMAHHIIRNALAVMTTAQQVAWAGMNARDGVDGEGATRAAERDALLAQPRMAVGSA